MPPRFAPRWRTGRLFGFVLTLSASSAVPLAGQELTLLRVYPGSGPYECLAPASPVLPTPDDRARAGQLASDANQALILGDLEQVQALLEQAVVLDPSSPDLAYRHARVLDNLDRAPEAMAEYCRSLDLDVESIGIFEARDRLNALSDELRAQIPAPARAAFARGLELADDSLFTEAAESFSEAIDIDPEWPEPLYNRAVVNERAGRTPQALRDFRDYLRLVAPDENQAIMVSERIGELEGMASIATPSPTGALALGLVPGMGHFYTSRPLMGSLTLSVAAMAFAAGYSYQEVTTLCLTDVPSGGTCPPRDIIEERNERPYFWIGLGIATAVTVASAVDAYLAAKGRRDAFTALIEPVDEVTVETGLPTVSSSGGRLDFGFVRLRFR